MNIIVPDTPRPSLRAYGSRLLAGPVGRFGALALLGSGVLLGITAGPLVGGPVQVGTAMAVYLCAAMAAGVAMWRSYPHPRIGLCNIVTLVRLILTTALIAPILGAEPLPWVVFSIAAMALALDAVDGWFARRQGLTSAFGARFDMEVDAALGLILAANALAAGLVGPLVLVLGLPRYVFAAAGLVLPWLSRPLPQRFGRKLACVIQIAVLVIVQPAILPPAIASGAIVIAATALAWSFGRDILWLWQKRH